LQKGIQVSQGLLISLQEQQEQQDSIQLET
jgi:hypothetical protein